MPTIAQQITDLSAKLHDQGLSPDEKTKIAKKLISLNNQLLMGLEPGNRTTDSAGQDRRPAAEGMWK